MEATKLLISTQVLARSSAAKRNFLKEPSVFLYFCHHAPQNHFPFLVFSVNANHISKLLLKEEPMRYVPLLRP